MYISVSLSPDGCDYGHDFNQLLYIIAMITALKRTQKARKEAKEGRERKESNHNQKEEGLWRNMTVVPI